jgi:ABC-type transport system involved in cytochrome c biogenesis permease subunit
MSRSRDANATGSSSSCVRFAGSEAADDAAGDDIMATGSVPTTRRHPPADDVHAGVPDDPWAVDVLAWDLFRGLGSLKITVVMFLAAVFLLFVGTLAQDEMNLPEVKAEYFNSWLARVPFSDFFPVTVFGDSRLTGWFPFPGGATIGLVMLLNLVAAKVTRFHVAARGQRLAWGTAIALLGGVLTLLVVLTGHRTDGLQGRPPIAYDMVWRMVQMGAVLVTVGLTVAAAVSSRRLVRFTLGISAAAAAVLAGVAIFGGESWRMNDPGLRILWQLIQSSVAALVLLAGLVMVFGSRGGNVLIHLAVGLLMVGQFAFGDRQIEERMSLIEGQTTNVAFRTDETELAVIDESDPADDRVTVISGRLLRARAGGEPIAIDGLPFTIRVVEYFPNSSVGRVGPVAPNPATTGLGSRFIALPRPPEGGASSQPNIASAYVRLTDSAEGRDLGTYLVSQFLNDQGRIFMVGEGDQCDTLEADGRPWRIQLRYRREYKPFDVTLDDVRRIDYSASETPRDYSSYVTFTDRGTGSEQKGRIWMNNPVRYRGETFYQSQYSQVDLGGGRTGEMTGLQVVENAGWLIPYVACVLAFWGMLVHFGGTFLRFADRHEREAGKEAPGEPSTTRGRPSRDVARAVDALRAPEKRGGWLPAALAIGLVAAIVLPRVWPGRTARTGVDGRSFDWATVAALPVLHEGRVKPFDSVARNTLQLLGNRTDVRMPSPPSAQAPRGTPEGTVPASQWLLGLMAGSEWVDHAPVFRIDAFEVLDLFDLERRQGHRYSAFELASGRPALRKQIEAAREVPAEQRSFVQKKYGEINQKLMAYDLIRFAYETPALPQVSGTDAAAKQQALGEIRRLMQGAKMLEDNHPPALIPPLEAMPAADAGAAEKTQDDWRALYPAVVSAMVARMLDGREGQPAYRLNPALLPLTGVLAAADEPAPKLAGAVADYRAVITDMPAVREVADKASFEAWLNRFNPTDLAKWLYVFASVLCFTSFLAWHRPLNHFVSWLLLATFVLHTFALVARVYLTGRPPVVNLYSSAVFIGWACVLAGLGLEALHRMGIGNLVAALTGGLTLMVAYGLDSGDTMHVLQAVLDTQFWLSTHVITVTLGYGATFLAGLLGTCAIVHRIWARFAPRAAAAAPRGGGPQGVQDRLYRMTYGVVCFALFFSFIGTVLGGLWADDSWGRFWGWDPKENGALMIVLWNAAVLHARWDRWIGPRGFALFAIAGNIVTAWSWFGTNQLGIGLHSYGFTSGVLMLLGTYVLSQLLLIAAGLTLTRSHTDSSAVAPAA